MEHKEQTQYFSQEVRHRFSFRSHIILEVVAGSFRYNCLYLQDIHELFGLPPQGFDVSLTQHQLQEEHGQQPVM